MHNASFATQTRHHNKETTSLKELQARLQFLRSRVNSHSDPAIQELIKQTKDAIVAATCAVRGYYNHFDCRVAKEGAIPSWAQEFQGVKDAPASACTACGAIVEPYRSKPIAPTIRSLRTSSTYWSEDRPG
jgi:hypothetical protein